MRTSIFIRTWWRDLEWLKFALASVDKFASGFDEVVVALPFDHHRDTIQGVCEEFGAKPVVGIEEPVGKGNLCSQFYAVSADLVCKSPFILYMDSDCVLNAPVTPKDYFASDEVPYLCCRPWDKCRQEERDAWEKVTNDVLGRKTTHHFMVRHPAVHHAWLLRRLREHIQAKYSQDCLAWILSRKATFPQGFSEFSALGAFAHAYYPEDYQFIDLSVLTEPPSHMVQHWSWGGHGGIKPEILESFAKLGLKE